MTRKVTGATKRCSTAREVAGVTTRSFDLHGLSRIVDLNWIVDLNGNLILSEIVVLAGNPILNRIVDLNGDLILNVIVVLAGELISSGIVGLAG